MSLEIELPDLPPEEETDEEIEFHHGFKRYVHFFVDAWFRTPARIAATAMLVLCCLLLIGWNLDRLSILDELVEIRVTQYELDGQLSELEFELNSIDLEALSSAIEAENDKVFQGFPELAAWAEGLAQIATAEGMIFSYKAEEPHLSPVPNVLEIPVMLEFKATAETADSLFTRSMNLIGRILRDHWHMDVVSTEASGNGAGMITINLQAQVWVRDRFGFVDVAALKSLEAPKRTDMEFELDD